jgi:hypothetical protein
MDVATIALTEGVDVVRNETDPSAYRPSDPETNADLQPIAKEVIRRREEPPTGGGTGEGDPDDES